MRNYLSQSMDSWTAGVPAPAKRTVQQAVFDSKEATRVAKAGHEEACRELAMTPRRLLDEGNPNHPKYDLHLFGVPADEFMAQQYRSAKA